jgi:hypothetical protein
VAERISDTFRSTAELGSVSLAMCCEKLAEVGHPHRALRWIERLERRLDPAEEYERICLLMTAAEVAHEAKLPERREKYLGQVLKLATPDRAGSDRSWEIEHVRFWRLDRGLLNPDECVNGPQRMLASIAQLLRECESLRSRSRRKARKKAMEALGLWNKLPANRQRVWHAERVAQALLDVGAPKAMVRALVKRRMTWKHDHRPSACGLARMGFVREAARRAQQEMWFWLRQPGFEFDVVSAIHRADCIELLVDIGERTVAGRLLERWIASVRGATSDPHPLDRGLVLLFLARAVAALGDMGRSEQFLLEGFEIVAAARSCATRSERLRDFIRAWTTRSAKGDPLDLVRGRRLPAGVMRYAKLVSASARNDWDAVHQVLRSCRSGLEAVELIHPELLFSE